MLRQAERLTYLAPQVIARHRVPGGFNRDRQPKPRMSEAVRFYSQPEEAIVDAPATGVDRIELQLAPQT
ncbi:MAG: hypothetical protein ABI769_10785 [Pseudomonadota bacterium]